MRSHSADNPAQALKRQPVNNGSSPSGAGSRAVPTGSVSGIPAELLTMIRQELKKSGIILYPDLSRVSLQKQVLMKIRSTLNRYNTIQLVINKLPEEYEWKKLISCTVKKALVLIDYHYDRLWDWKIKLILKLYIVPNTDQSADITKYYLFKGRRGACDYGEIW